MRLTSVMMLCLAVTVLAGCDDDDVTTPALPPLAGVRIINGTSDGRAIDVRSITQVEWTPVANGLAYRNATIHFGTEAKTHTFRVFPTSTQIDVTSQILHEAAITFQANAKYTLLVTGSVTAGTVQIFVLNDDIAPSAQIGVRLVNTSPAPIDGHLVSAVGDALLATPTWSNVGSLTASAYVARAPGAAAVRVTPAGSASALASAAGPAAQAPPAGDPVLPAAGVNSASTRLSAYFFAAVPALAASQGRPAVAATAESVIWFIDRNPEDPS